MTNEEKANEIVFGWTDDVQECAKDAAMEMAEWKDTQFKKYLEKKKDEYLHEGENYRKTEGLELIAIVSETRKDTMDKIINELFGED